MTELKRSIEGYTAAKEGHDQKIAECSEFIQQIGAELKTLDERLRALRPRMKLDTLDNRCMGTGVWEWVYVNGCVGTGIWERVCGNGEITS